MNYAFSEDDVLTMKGAAAQQTTQKGNLKFYQLCESRFSEYQSADKEKRHLICVEIVDSILQTGVFRNMNGKVMDKKKAVSKTSDRMRQIKKPKQTKPSNVGEDDVVFKAGAANHLFPGNAKWRTVVDTYVKQYWPEMFSSGNEQTDDGKESGNSGDSNTNQNKKVIKRPDYQVEIANEIIDIIHSRGGKFRGHSLKVLERRAAEQKVHERFKELKKVIKQGKKRISNEPTVEEYIVKRTGCTSSKRTVPWGQEQPIRKRRKKKKQQSAKTSVGHAQKDDDTDDDNSFDSQILTDDENSESSDDDHDDDDNDEKDFSEYKRALVERQEQQMKKSDQDKARSERLKRREEAATQPKPKPKKAPKKKRRRSHQEDYLPPEPSNDMSDYERLRHEKIIRNHRRLSELGLLYKP